jgi:hypothetical protein
VPRRHEVLQAKIGRFLDEYCRPKRPGKGEPNDRHYDREFERRIKRMDPRELDALMHD